MKSCRHSSGLTGRGLKRLLAGICDCAHQDVSRLKQQESVAVHQLRVRMKKLLALFRLAEGAIEDQSLAAMRQHARSVKNACASLRDGRVRDRLVDKLVHRHHLHIKPEVAAPVKSRLRPPSTFLRHQLHALEQLIDKTSIESIAENHILSQHARCYRKGRRLMKQAAEAADEPTWHRWRHRVKDLYFQTLVLASFQGARRRAHRAKHLGSLLGRDHDFSVLALEPAFCSRRSPWPDIIRERREAIRQRCIALGHKLYNTHSSRFSQHLHSAA